MHVESWGSYAEQCEQGLASPAPRQCCQQVLAGLTVTFTPVLNPSVWTISDIYHDCSVLVIVRTPTQPIVHTPVHVLDGTIWPAARCSKHQHSNLMLGMIVHGLKEAT